MQTLKREVPSEVASNALAAVATTFLSGVGLPALQRYPASVYLRTAESMEQLLRGQCHAESVCIGASGAKSAISVSVCATG